MADPSAQLQIPDDLRQKYPDLIELVVGSESMNNEERQYWINILPIMTPEQVQNLREILQNEKQQLAAIDAKYSKEIERIGEAELVKKIQTERSKRREERSKGEQEARHQEDVSSEELLRKIDAA